MTGIVVAVDEQSCCVRVEFPDRDGLVSGWLPVMQDFCVGNQEYKIPDEGNQVVCLMDEHCEDGVVLGAIYSNADPPPVTSRDLYYRRFKDGTSLQYDRDAHKLSADVQGDIDIAATGNITSTAPLWTHNGKLTVTDDVTAQKKITATNDITSTGGNITAPAGDVADKVRSQAADRDIYDGHDHVYISTAGPLHSNPPTQQE